MYLLELMRRVLNKLQRWLNRPDASSTASPPDCTSYPQTEDNQFLSTSEEETRYILNRILSIPGLWEDLCNATEEGKPRCLGRVIEIARQSGIIETKEREDSLTRESHDSQDNHPKDSGPWKQANSFTIYSEHHEATAQIELSSLDSWRFRTIIWALEGQVFKR
jgi:hypothetical protein